MSRPCSQCNNDVNDVEMFCRFCLAEKCPLCCHGNHVIRFSHDDMVDHMQKHKDIKSSMKHPVFWIHCSSELFGGCGALTPSSDRVCHDCKKKLLFDNVGQSTSLSSQRYLGEMIYFIRKNAGFPTKGFIVSINSSINEATVRYYERAYRFEKYDENCHLSLIFTTLDEADLHLKSTRRVNQSEASSSASSVLSTLSRSFDHSDVKVPKRKILDITRKNVKNDSYSLLDDPPKKMKEVIHRQTKNSKTKNKPESIHKVQENDISKSFVDTNADISTIPFEELIKSVQISGYSINAITRKSYCDIDEYIRRGVMFAIIHWALPHPMHNGITEEEVSKKYIPLSVKVLEDLVKYLPTTIEELTYIESCSSLRTQTHSHQVLEVIRKYLQSRCRSLQRTSLHPNPPLSINEIFSISNLKTMNISLPLSYPVFNSVMIHAYECFGGREQLENARGIAGQVIAKGENDNHRTMYGGARESFIETQIIQRTRIGKDDVFLDVGSGIGQICIQVALTVGCKCYGLEIIQERHDAAVVLLEVVDKILDSIDCRGRLGDLIEFKKADFAHESRIVADATVTFFNNYGPWFASPEPGKCIDYCHEYCSQITMCNPGSQILVVSPLVEATHWLHETTFESDKADFTWTDHPLVVYKYTVPAEKCWTCQHCTLLNYNLLSENCEACDTKLRHVRPKGRSTNLR